MNKKEIKKGCHSRVLLSGIFNACRGVLSCGKQQNVEDPRLQPSGMTPCFMKSRAFTLIELLVVVLIIGILSAIALPQYQFAVKKTRYTHLQIMCKSIADAEEVHYLANGNYATDMADLSIELPEGYTEQGFEIELTEQYVVCKHNDAQGNADLARFFVTFQHGQTRYAPLARYCYGETNFCKRISITGQIEEGTAAYRLP